MGERTKVTVAGWTRCAFFQKAANVVASLEHLFPRQVQAEIIELKDRDTYKAYLPKVYEKIPGSEGHTSSPLTWLNDEKYLGGCDDTLAYARTFFSGTGSAGLGQVASIKEDTEAEETYDYDLVVIGGGSGGLAASKEAAGLGAKVALLDFVKPSPQGTSWGLGGTCVNVGCIPKKLFHHSALFGEGLHDAKDFGWDISVEKHDWSRFITNVRNYIKSLNFGYKVQLRTKQVKYLNKLGSLVDAHTVSCVDKKGKEEKITAKRILIAVGGRPKQLQCPGSELAITSDDMFFLEKPPGKTLVVGASYVALECASFLTGLGYDTTVMVRSIFLRGFDQQMADMVGDAMQKTGTKFIRSAVPTSLEKTSDGRIKVTWGDNESDVYDTVLAAIGRSADTKEIGLENVGLKVDGSGKLSTEFQQTSVPSIFAIGDCEQGVAELTPVAIALGRNLSNRLYGKLKEATDLNCVPTAIFAGLEYGCVGLSEEEAKEKYGSALEVYHTYFTPLQWTICEKREFNQCYCKVLVDKEENERVVGMHILSPEAGEIIQAYGVPMKMGMTFKDLTDLVGIHPTIGEELCMVEEPKSSGKDAQKSGC
uniref:Thioredoxin reductase n=2 Tax=Mucochytrium quahogii TaxID=96639 RepID=A0A7S2WBE6_9STRA